MEKPEKKSYQNPKDLPSLKETQKSLLQKEYELNVEEQLLLKKRIETMRQKMKMIGKDDPEYGLMNMEIDKDEIFLDELLARQEELKGLLESA